jgi:ATP-dependent Lon protease
MSVNSHHMTTRGKAILKPVIDSDSDSDSEDEHGNLKGFIDYDNYSEDDFDHQSYDQLELNRELDKEKEKEKKHKKKHKKKPKQNNKDKQKAKLNDVFMTYLIMKATEKANEEMKIKRKTKKQKVLVEVSDESCSEDSALEDNLEKINLDEKATILNITFSSDSDDSSFKGTLDTLSGSDTLSDNLSLEEIGTIDETDGTDGTDGSDAIDDSSSEEYTFEYDKHDEDYEELIDKQMLKNSEEKNMEYFHYLDKETKEKLFNLTREIYEYNGSNVPLRFKVIESDMDMKTKAIALENIDKMVEMDVSTGEHSKMDLWINGLMRIPFAKYNYIPINPESSISEKREFIKNTYQTLDKAIYGHKEAKTHILQVVGKWMKNPDSSGNVLAIQGPMGNGKTTLVKDGISKVLNRPFHFIALGGASDSAYFDGHCYTYEGSHWGRIVQILQDSKCMNPIIYFDELDKISDTNKGEEIIHMLTHLTDPSQNNLFQDNYFPGVNLDLSKALFIFSYNDESKVNRILRDRMYVIHTKGFKTDDKIKICNEYLIPEIFDTFAFEKNELVFTNEIIKKIVEKFTEGEEGVRNLKRCIETIVSKINIHILSDGDSGLSFQLKELVLPLTLTEEHIDILLKVDNSDDKPPYGMYC